MGISTKFLRKAVAAILPPADADRVMQGDGAVIPLGYDRSAVQIGIVHFGTGRRLRAAVAPLFDRILSSGHLNFGLVAVSQTDGPSHKSFKDRDGLYTLTEMDGGMAKTRMIGSVVRVLHARQDVAEIVAAVADPRTLIVSVTFGELGYGDNECSQINGSNAKIAHDYSGIGEPQSTIGQIVAGLVARRNAGCAGLTILACDNVIGGNLVLANAIDAMAVARDVELADWIAMNIRFPAVIGDRILLNSADLASSDESTDITTEAYSNWIIEDNLGEERKALLVIGTTIVTDIRASTIARERLLEGALSFLTYAGLLRGHVYLNEAMHDEVLWPLLDRFLAEVAETLPAIGGFEAGRYITGLRERFSNQDLGMPLLRLARNGSRKLGARIVPVIVERHRRGKSAEIAASTIAAWLVHSIAPEAVDDFSDQLRQAAKASADDWSSFVEHACAIEPIFGAIGKNPAFRQLVTQSIVLFPGFESMVDG